MVMRHLMEVTMVVEGSEGWARRLGQSRTEQGRPLASTAFASGSGTSSNNSSRHSSHSRKMTISNSSAIKLVMRVIGLSKAMGRLVVSFI